MSRQSFRKVDLKTNTIVDITTMIERNNYENIVMTKRHAMLRFMIDGKKDLTFSGETYGGKGAVTLNKEGGFGFDSIVHKMIKNGEIVIRRENLKMRGLSNVNHTIAYVTPIGVLVYKKLEKRFYRHV
jgi:hypothetical protein